MEEMLLKIGEFGALGVVTIYLLTKGTSALKDLADSNKSLADSVKTLAEKVNVLDGRLHAFEHQFRAIENRLDKIENQFTEFRRYLETNNIRKRKDDSK
ncbi:MAG: hypothetical protein IJ685_04540 [Selenomonadaceae bacterium]|nr:hypothetical protein [Selenomonadaceae bacterium]